MLCLLFKKYLILYNIIKLNCTFYIISWTSRISGCCKFVSAAITLKICSACFNIVAGMKFKIKKHFILCIAFSTWILAIAIASVYNTWSGVNEGYLKKEVDLKILQGVIYLLLQNLYQLK